MKTIELLLSENIMNKFSPSHYQRGKIEVWDFIADQELDYFTGNVVNIFAVLDIKIVKLN